MSLDYTKVWNAMNDLDDTITNYVHIKELLQSYNKKNDKFIECIITLLDHYIDLQDQTFKVAWNETVSKIHSSEDEAKDDGMRPWGHSDLEYLIANKPKRWILPIEQQVIDGVDDYYITFPDDLLEAANIKENDVLEWVDQGDGSWLLKKVEQ